MKNNISNSDTSFTRRFDSMINQCSPKIMDRLQKYKDTKNDLWKNKDKIAFLSNDIEKQLQLPNELRLITKKHVSSLFDTYSEESISTIIDLTEKTIKNEMLKCFDSKENSYLDLTGEIEEDYVNFAFMTTTPSAFLINAAINKKSNLEDVVLGKKNSEFITEEQLFSMFSVMVTYLSYIYSESVGDIKQGIRFTEISNNFREFFPKQNPLTEYLENPLFKIHKSIIELDMWIMNLIKMRKHTEEKDKYEEELKSKQSMLSKLGKNNVASRWNLRNKALEKLNPQIDKMAEEGIMHHKIAEKIYKQNRGKEEFQYSTANLDNHEISQSEIKIYIKKYFVKTNREHLIFGQQRTNKL